MGGQGSESFGFGFFCFALGSFFFFVFYFFFILFENARFLADIARWKGGNGGDLAEPGLM
jgi:hypothetical protein